MLIFINTIAILLVFVAAFLLISELTSRIVYGRLVKEYDISFNNIRINVFNSSILMLDDTAFPYIGVHKSILSTYYIAFGQGRHVRALRGSILERNIRSWYKIAHAKNNRSK